MYIRITQCDHVKIETNKMDFKNSIKYTNRISVFQVYMRNKLQAFQIEHDITCYRNWTLT